MYMLMLCGCVWRRMVDNNGKKPLHFTCFNNGFINASVYLRNRLLKTYFLCFSKHKKIHSYNTLFFNRKFSIVRECKHHADQGRHIGTGRMDSIYIFIVYFFILPFSNHFLRVSLYIIMLQTNKHTHTHKVCTFFCSTEIQPAIT